MTVNQDLPPGLADDEIEGLTQLVAESLAKGEDPQAVAQQLIDSGWEPDQANGFVSMIHEQMLRRHDTGGQSQAMGWMVWLGVILGINFLSWIFNWGFWIY